MDNLNVKCPEHFFNVVVTAAQRNVIEDLKDSLKRVCELGKKAFTYSKVELFSDFEQMSFGFVILGRDSIADDWKFYLNGGIIYNTLGDKAYSIHT